MSDEQNETDKVSEELVGEIDQAIEEVTVISEGSEGTVEVSDSKENPEGNTKEDTPQETQEDTQDRAYQSKIDSEDTPEGSVEDTPTDTTEEPEEELPVSLSQESIVRAMGNGLTYSEASSFGSEEALKEFSGRIEYQKQTQETKVQQQEQEVVDPFVDLPKLDPESYDPEIIDMFNRLTGIVKGQYETIQGFQENQSQFQTNQDQFQEHYLAASKATSQAEIENWFDDEVKKLGDDFEDVLGSGKYQTLDQESLQFKNRDAIANHMGILIAGYNSQGLPAPPRSEVFESATRQILADKFGQIKNDKLSGELEKQSKQHIQRANKSSSTAVKTPDEEDAELAELIDSKFGQ